ncbi:hypothetical protein ACT3TS_01175 [Specibacter sp. AOP5-B1-6]
MAVNGEAGVQVTNTFKEAPVVPGPNPGENPTPGQDPTRAGSRHRTR